MSKLTTTTFNSTIALGRTVKARCRLPLPAWFRIVAANFVVPAGRNRKTCRNLEIDPWLRRSRVCFVEVKTRASIGLRC
jgi:hypothetical protein